MSNFHFMLIEKHYFCTLTIIFFIFHLRNTNSEKKKFKKFKQKIIQK